jgi:hypothetical protein
MYAEEDEKYSATLRAVRHAYRLVCESGQGTDAVREAEYYLVP